MTYLEMFLSASAAVLSLAMLGYWGKWRNSESVLKTLDGENIDLCAEVAALNIENRKFREMIEIRDRTISNQAERIGRLDGERVKVSGGATMMGKWSTN